MNLGNDTTRELCVSVKNCCSKILLGIKKAYIWWVQFKIIEQNIPICISEQRMTQ